MTIQTDAAGSFTLPGTSMNLNRMGYGAMQLAGPDVTNQIIRQALHPYPDGLTIVTIGAVHDSLRNLGLEVLDVVNLRVGGIMGPSEGRSKNLSRWYYGCHNSLIGP